MPSEVTYLRIVSCCLIVAGISTSRADTEVKGQQICAAMKRHKVDDSENKIYTRFRYSTVCDVMVDSERFDVPPEALQTEAMRFEKNLLSCKDKTGDRI